jgi:hypothetical protein
MRWPCQIVARFVFATTFVLPIAALNPAFRISQYLQQAWKTDVRSQAVQRLAHTWSDSGVGAEVELTVASSVAYAKSSNIRRFNVFRKRMDAHGN